MQYLHTWAHGSMFGYDGSVYQGTRIQYGVGAVSANAALHIVEVVWLQYLGLLKDFAGHTVPVGTSHTDPPPGSLGWWLKRVVTQTGIASYVAPILIHEGYAVRANAHEIRVLTATQVAPGVLIPGN